MKTPTLISLVAAVSTTLAIAAESDPAAKQLQLYPKNLARQHLGANLFVFNAASQTYVPTEAAAAWLDDDITTGWPASPGKQHYLVALPEPEVISNFSVSSRPATGTISLYAGDEPAIPGAKSWSPLATGVSLDAINEKKLAKPFTRLAKYVLIETDIANSAPIYSLNLYGDKPAVDYTLRKRPQAIDSRAIFGPYVNNQTAFNLNGLYAQSTMTYANSGEGFLSWQKAADDNPESSVTIAASTEKAGAVIKYGSAQEISRIALLTDSTAKGKLEFFLVNDAPAVASAEAAPNSGIIKASNPAPATAADPAPAGPVSLEGRAPSATIALDGSNSRTSVNFPAVQAGTLLVRWTPSNGTDSIAIRELESFGALSLNDYEVGMRPETVAARGTGLEAKDGKEAIAQGPRDPKDPKGPLDPLAAGPTGSPYLPAALGFPPNINFFRPNVTTDTPSSGGR